MSLTFGGFDLTTYAFVRIERQVGPTTRVEVQQVPGRAGDVVMDEQIDALQIIAHCTLKRTYISQWESTRQLLAKAFSGVGEKSLVLPDEPNCTHKARASFDATGVAQPLEPPVEFSVTFTCHDPFAYSTTTKTATVPSGSSVSITVGGTHSVRLSASATAAVRDSTTQLWGLKLDGGDHMHVKLSGSSSRSVVIDGITRRVTDAGASSMITTDSNWLEVSPGTHTVQMDKGTGVATISWIERWL